MANKMIRAAAQVKKSKGKNPPPRVVQGNVFEEDFDEGSPTSGRMSNMEPSQEPDNSMEGSIKSQHENELPSKKRKYDERPASNTTSGQSNLGAMNPGADFKTAVSFASALFFISLSRKSEASAIREMLNNEADLKILYDAIKNFKCTFSASQKHEGGENISGPEGGTSPSAPGPGSPEPPAETEEEPLSPERAGVAEGGEDTAGPVAGAPLAGASWDGKWKRDFYGASTRNTGSGVKKLATIFDFMVRLKKCAAIFLTLLVDHQDEMQFLSDTIKEADRVFGLSVTHEDRPREEEKPTLHPQRSGDKDRKRSSPAIPYWRKRALKSLARAKKSLLLRQRWAKPSPLAPTPGSPGSIETEPLSPETSDIDDDDDGGENLTDSEEEIPWFTRAGVRVSP